MAGLSMVDQDFYGVYPLRGKQALKSSQESAEIRKIMRIIGLEYTKKICRCEVFEIWPFDSCG
ncbi:hypothetical protein OSB04_008031 [Centaurea solstitialis]|uniref:Uncharacterized protein n=1 Tax=Centaurea solstitialis TaxID=347529 RepID=A0AA38TWH9_9ASTR|nr:hypothetical protein OSB04_008031 [Centaurea solstitialis]